jgi:hypothetical protein
MLIRACCKLLHVALLLKVHVDFFMVQFFNTGCYLASNEMKRLIMYDELEGHGEEIIVSHSKVLFWD